MVEGELALASAVVAVGVFSFFADLSDFAVLAVSFLESSLCLFSPEFILASLEKRVPGGPGAVADFASEREGLGHCPPPLCSWRAWRAYRHFSPGMPGSSARSSISWVPRSKQTFWTLSSPYILFSIGIHPVCVDRVQKQVFPQDIYSFPYYSCIAHSIGRGFSIGTSATVCVELISLLF